MTEDQSNIESWWNRDSVLGFSTEGPRRWVLRHDVRRVLLVEYALDDMRMTDYFVLAPIEAIMLAHFDGSTRLSSILARFADLLHLNEAGAKAFVTFVLKRRQKMLEEVRPGREYASHNPLDFVIRKEDVDMRVDRFYRPIFMIAYMSDDCGRNCRYCNVERRVLPLFSYMPVQRWKEIIDEISSFGMFSVTLSGGEPFLRKDIFEIIAMLAEKKIGIDISTKAHITKPMAEKLALYKPRLQYSIDALDPALADYLAGTANFFAEAVDSICNLVSCGVQVRTNTIMTSLNARQFPDLIRFLGSLGVYQMRSLQYRRSHHLPKASDLLLDPDDAVWVDEQVSALKAYYDVRFSWRRDHSTVPKETKAAQWLDRTKCSGGRNGFVVRADGKVTLCSEMPLDDAFIVGDLSRQGVMEVWNSPELSDLLCPSQDRFSGTVCANCEDFARCHEWSGRCFFDSLRAYGSFYAPDPRCPKAPPHLRLV